MTTAAPAPIEIFRSGIHTAMSGDVLTFSDADLAGCAAAYDPGVWKAPLVKGHPRNDDPRYGEVKAVRFADGTLTAEVDWVEPAFAELVRSRRYTNVSASFWQPDSPTNPKPGTWYLRHVGFLGAVPPAVKGLKPVQFATDQAGVVAFGDVDDMTIARMFRSLRDWVLGKFGQDEADKALPAWTVDDVQEQAAQPDPIPNPQPVFKEVDPPMSDDVKKREAEMDSREAELKRREEELKAKTQSFAEQNAAARRAADQMFFNTLVEERRASPQEKPEILGIMGALEAGKPIEFSEGGKTVSLSPLDAYKAQLLARRPLADFGERSGGDVVLRGDQADPVAIARRIHEFCESELKAGRIVSVSQAAGHLAKEFTA